MSDIFCTSKGQMIWALETVWFCALTNKADVYFMMNGKTLKQCWPNEPQTLCKHSSRYYMASLVIDFQPTQPTHEATQALVPTWVLQYRHANLKSGEF